MASVYGQPVNGTLPGSYNPLAAQQAAPALLLKRHQLLLIYMAAGNSSFRDSRTTG
jgi:hypothetical protein